MRYINAHALRRSMYARAVCDEYFVSDRIEAYVSRASKDAGVLIRIGEVFCGPETVASRHQFGCVVVDLKSTP